MIFDSSSQLQGAGAEIYHQYVRFGDQLAVDLLPLGLARIQGGGFLVARDDREPDRLAVGPFAAPFAHGVADARLFQLDHLGAEIAQKLGAERPGQELAHFDHAQIG